MHRGRRRGPPYVRDGRPAADRGRVARIRGRAALRAAMPLIAGGQPPRHARAGYQAAPAGVSGAATGTLRCCPVARFSSWTLSDRNGYTSANRPEAATARPRGPTPPPSTRDGRTRAPVVTS